MDETDIYREWPPPPGWAGAVACCWEQRVGATREHRVIPDGHADLLRFASGPIQVVGLHDQVDRPVLAAGTHIRGIRFRAAAVGPAFRTEASALRNRTVDAESVLGAGPARRLADPGRLDSWIRSIEPATRVTAAVELLGRRRVEAVAAALGITARQLCRIVESEVGLTPKVYQGVQRLQRFVRAVDGGRPLADAAVEAGYSDQSHLTRDVRRYCGITPGRLARERRRN